MLAPVSIDSLVESYPVIQALPPRLQHALHKQGQPVRANPGQVLFSDGDACNHFLMVTQGELRVVKNSAGGREMELYRLLPGDSCILTVSCLLGEAQYPANGIVESELHGVTIPRALFDQLVAESPAFRRFVFAFFAARLNLLMALIEAVAFQRLDGRLAARLTSAGPRVNKTHQMLADELGSVREVITRILKEFESQGLVRLDRGQVQVLDPVGLSRISAADEHSANAW